MNVTLTHDGTRARLYVDGFEANSALLGFDAVRQSELRIGCAHMNTPESYWQGKLDDLRIYRAALGSNDLGAVNEWIGDADGDRLTNGEEYERGTDPRDADTDDDTLSDYQEVRAYGTDPLQADSDADGMPDPWELTWGLNPRLDDSGLDPDGDGLTHGEEHARGTHPLQADPDGDGLNDRLEVIYHGTNPWDADTDDDTLSDYQEVMTYGTDPLKADTDNDTLPDAWEVLMGISPLSGNGDDGPTGDPDQDGLINSQERLYGTHPLKSDTDADGLSDSIELSTTATDPLDADTDADELPDGWEVQYGLDPLSGMQPGQNLLCWLKFDETPGTNPVNSARSGLPVQARGTSSANWTTGVHRGGFRFDGTNDYLAVIQGGTPAVTSTAFTLAAWVWYEPDQRKGFPTLLSDSRWPGGTTWPGYLLRASTNEDVLSLIIGDETHPAEPLRVSRWGTVRAGRWVHVAAVQDSARSRLYVNGTLSDEKTNVFAAAAQPEIWIGRGHVNADDSWWRGLMDDVRLYGRALSPAELQSLFDAQADPNGDGESNLEAYRNGHNPTSLVSQLSSEGALELLLVPGTWGTNSSLQYLAHFDDGNPGCEVHLYLERDALDFALYDAQGVRHSIRHRDLVGGGYMIAGATNRITASWRGFNNGTNTAEMRLFVNGLDRRTTSDNTGNPCRTAYNWEQGEGYALASFMQADFRTVVRTNRMAWGSREGGLFPLNAQLVAARVYTEPYGMVSTNPVLPFALAGKTPPTRPRARTLLQTITRPGTFPTYVSSNEVRVLVQRYRQVADAAEYEMSWMGWAQASPSLWDIMEENIRATISAANEQGFGICLSTSSRLDAKICTKYSNSIPAWAERAEIVVDGATGRVTTAPVTWRADQTYLATMFDIADPSAAGSYLQAWKTDLLQYAQYTHFLFNEDVLQSELRPYTYSPTYSLAGLAWFRQYTTAKYGTAYSQIKFPISPVPIRMFSDTNSPAYTKIVLDASVTNRMEITTDPDVWAKWWEWRRVVFASLIHGYCEALHEINASNPYWEGAIYLFPPGASWTENTALDLALLSRIPHLDFVVMENHRGDTYGTSLPRLEEEVQLQLRAMKDAASTNTGFGSYVMAHAYPYPSIQNGVTTFTCNITWMTQDVAYAAAPEFQSQIVVPYSASVLVNRPGFTSDFQRATYVPEVADAWLRERFLRLWTPIDNLYPDGGTATYTYVFFNWSYIDQSHGYEWQLSTSPDFSVTNVEAQAYSSYHGWSILTDPMPTGQALYWRVRSVFHVYSYSDNGDVTGTNSYYGTWASDTDRPLYLQDDDSDGLPDAWELYYFYSLLWEGEDDPDGDLIPNSEEYLLSTYPGGYGTIGP